MDIGRIVEAAWGLPIAVRLALVAAVTVFLFPPEWLRHAFHPGATPSSTHAPAPQSAGPPPSTPMPPTHVAGQVGVSVGSIGQMVNSSLSIEGNKVTFAGAPSDPLLRSEALRARYGRLPYTSRPLIATAMADALRTLAIQGETGATAAPPGEQEAWRAWLRAEYAARREEMMAMRDTLLAQVDQDPRSDPVSYDVASTPAEIRAIAEDLDRIIAVQPKKPK